MDRLEQFEKMLADLQAQYADTAARIADFTESFRELRKILLIQKDFVSVVRRRTIGSRNFPALGDGQEPVIAACSPDIEKISTTARLYGFGEDLISIILIVASWLGWG